MLAVVAITVLYLAFVWLVFLKFKWLRLTPVWGFISLYFILHLTLVPLIGMRFISPYTKDVVVVRHTIQITPRLPEPTLVERILVEEGQPVKKGDALFMFDRSLYEYQVNEAEAVLESAKQNVLVLEADVQVAREAVARAQAELDYRQIEANRYTQLASQGAAPKEEAQRWEAHVAVGQADVASAKAQLARAEAAYGAQIDGVNTQVIEAQAQLQQAQYFLSQTVIYAPADGKIVNLQVQEGMVAGIVRFGAIASFIVDDDPYLLAMYRQENLQFVEPGQPVLVALNIYPGKTLKATVKDIWWASGRGQFLPSGTLPIFPDAMENPEARMPVQITFDDPSVNLPIGAEGAALILTDEENAFTWVGQIALRAYTWGRYVYPFPL